MYLPVGPPSYTYIIGSHDNCMTTKSTLDEPCPWLGSFPGFQCCMPPAFQHVTLKPGNGPKDEVRALAMLKSIVNPRRMRRRGMVVVLCP